MEVKIIDSVAYMVAPLVALLRESKRNSHGADNQGDDAWNARVEAVLGKPVSR
jgi:hypothetical protein